MLLHHIAKSTTLSHTAKIKHCIPARRMPKGHSFNIGPINWTLWKGLAYTPADAKHK